MSIMYKFVHKMIIVKMLLTNKDNNYHMLLINNANNHVKIEFINITMKHYLVQVKYHVKQSLINKKDNCNISYKRITNAYNIVLTNGGSQTIIMKNNVLKLKYVIHKLIMFTKIIMNV